MRWVQLCGSLSILWHCLSLGLEWKLTFSSPVATAEISKFAVILSAALSQHHLSGFEPLNPTCFRMRYCLQMPGYWGTEDHFPTPSPRALIPRTTGVVFLTPLRSIVSVIHTALIQPSCVGSQCGDKGALLTLSLFSSTSSFCVKLSLEKKSYKN